MFSRIVSSALFAGMAAGLAASLLQLVFVQPILLHAELYEAGTIIHNGSNGQSTVQAIAGFEAQRDLLSVFFSALIYTGYGFVLVALMALADERGHKVTVRSGVFWGLAGFIAVQLAPAFSLAPEVPGNATADVYDRQIWWFATAIAAAAAMWLIAFVKAWPFWLCSAVLLLAPHIIGAPQAERFSGVVPPELSALFASRSLGTSLVAWLLLGCFAAYFWNKEAE